jgi:serine/threonine-protein kinase RsbW
VTSAQKKPEESIDKLAPGQVVRLNLPAQHKFLNVVGNCIRALLANEDQLPDRTALVYNIELAVHEACANIVEHAYAGLPGRIGVTFTLAEPPRCLVVDLEDNGRSFDISTVVEPDLSQPHTGGYGLFLVHQLMDSVSYFPQPGSNHWRLVKNY